MVKTYKDNNFNGKQLGPDGKLYVIPGGPLDPAIKGNTVSAPSYFEGATAEQKAAFDKGVEFVRVGEGVFKNKSGEFVDASGKKTEKPESITDLVQQTYAEKAQSQFEGQFRTDFEAAQRLGIDLPYSTFEEYKAYINQGKQSDLNYLTQQQEIARNLEASQTASALESLAGSESSVQAGMAQSREGAMTTSKPQFAQEFSTQINRQREQIRLERQSAEAQRLKAMADLKRAQEAGDVSLASAIQGQLSAIEDNIRQIDILASEEARAVQANQRANFETFTSFVNEGQTLTAQGIKNLAGQLNIDFESAFDYYQSVENIRVDKSLSQTEKEIAIQDAALELDRKMTNRDLLEVRKVDYLTSLYQSGASQEEISAYKQLAGITDENDPLYQAELRIKQADAKVKEMQAAGELPVGSTEWLEREQQKIQLAKEQKEYYDTYGGSWDTDAFQIGEEVGWCGVYASKLSTASSVGDYWYQKKTKIQSQSPTVGDKLLIPIGVSNENADYGHVAVVLGYDSETGIIQVAESNKDGRQNKGTGLGIATFGTYTVDELNAKYGSEWGVAHGDLKDEYKSAYNPSGNKPKLEPKEVQKLDKELRSTDEYKSLNKSNKSLSALLEFERIWKESGEDLDFIGKDVGKLRTSYRTALLELKEYFNLGVLNGPDLQIMEEIMPDPTSLSERGAALIGRGGADAVTAGIENLKKQLYSSIDERYETINEIYGSYEGQLDSLASLKRKFGEAGIDTEILQSGEKSVPTINPATTPTLSKYGVSADYDSIIDNNN